MDWGRVERKLAGAFRARPLRIGSALVVYRRRPLSLATVLEPELTDDERVEYGSLAAWPGSVSELLEEERAAIDLLGFSWDSLGPMSWAAGMELVGTGSRRYLCVWDEVKSYRAVAAVEPWDDASAVSAAVSSYLSCNGRRHGDGLFGSLPHEVTNYRPDLLPTPVVEQALFDYMQWAESVEPGTWALLASEHYGLMVEPNHLQRSLDVLEMFGSLDLDEIVAESAAMPDHARQQLFAEWFETAYQVVGQGA